MGKPEDIKKEALALHRQLRGKLSVNNKTPLNTARKLRLFYTPGVGEVSRYVAQHPNEAREYTGINNSVAVISDGSAVLGLGNIGPLGALPVMEGKAMLFKQFAGIDAFPIVLNTKSPAETTQAILAIAPSFGAINLEDFAAPQCFEIEDALKKALSIPVMHDDQHGTAIVVLAGLINALKVVHKQMDDCRIVIVGAGAAGNAVAKILYNYGRAEVLVCDSKGLIYTGRSKLDAHKQRLAAITNPRRFQGSVAEALKDADMVIGVSQPKAFSTNHIKTMTENPVVFALANPDPEVLPLEAKAAGARVVATGRSDFPNQINNALAFPGVFRGALDHHVKSITEAHKVKAAVALAKLVPKPVPSKIIPSIFDKRIVPAISRLIT